MLLSKQYAHWHQYFEHMSVSPLEFYRALDAEFKAGHVPQATSSHVEFLERGPLSSKRIYLQIQRDWLTYHICVAPFGSGFFASSRLLISPWNSWPTMAGIALVLAFVDFLIFIGTAAGYGFVPGLLVAVLLAIPLGILFLIALAVWVFLCLRITYSRLDTMLAFHEAVHGRLVTQVNKLLEAGGRRALNEQEAKPVMHRLLQRAH